MQVETSSKLRDDFDLAVLRTSSKREAVSCSDLDTQALARDPSRGAAAAGQASNVLQKDTKADAGALNLKACEA